MLESPQDSSLIQLQLVNNQTHFDRTTGTLFLFGDEAANTFQQAIAPNGYLELAIDNNKYSSDTQSPFFAPFLIGATDRSIQNIIFDGGDGDDKLTLGGQLDSPNLSITADDSIDITGSLTATNNLSILSDKLTLNQATLTATDNTNGGTIHLLSKDISVINSAIAATGSQSGGTILIGGDYQGKGTVPNAINTTIDSSTTIKADALQTGNGGKIIVWADDTTKYSGNISAKGGAVSGDGGFAEVSGKQNLAFQGTADLTAPNGQAGTLLLDPENVIISEAATAPGDPPEPFKIDANVLEQIAGSVNISASNSILLLTDLNFVSGGTSSSISFSAGGSFIGSGDIIAPGRLVSINAPLINTQAIDTTSTKGGSITLNGSEGITATTLSANAVNQAGDIKLTSVLGSIGVGLVVNNGKTGGKVEISARGDITTADVNSGSFNGVADDIKITSEIGSITTAGVYASGLNNGARIDLTAKGNISTTRIVSASPEGSGKAVTLISTEGKITTQQDISSWGKNRGGNVTLTSTGNISIGVVYAVSSIGNAGDTKLTSTLAGINTSGIYSFAWGGTTVLGGNINLQAATNISTGTLISSSAEGKGGNINLQAATNISTGTLISSSAEGKGGNINVTSTGGAIDAGESSVLSNSVSGSAGNIKLKATAITTGLVDAGANGNGNGGAIRLETSGNIATSAIVTNSNGSGNSGNITLISTNGNINATGNSVIYAGANSGTAGKVNIQAEGNIIVPAIGATSNTGTGNDIKLNSNNGGVEVQGEVLSWSNAGNAGDIRIEAKNNVKTGAVDAHAGQAVSNLVAPSALSSVNAAGGGAVSLNASRVVNIPAPSGILPIGSPLAIPAISVPVLAPTSIPSLTPTPAPVANSGLVGNNINPGFASALLSPTGSGNGGKVTLISNQGDITADYIRSDSAGGTGGNIKLDAAKFVKVTDSVSIDDIDYSIYADGGVGGSDITIKHNGGQLKVPFSIGDKEKNGTKSAIATDDAGIFPIASPLIFAGKYTLRDIDISTSNQNLASFLGTPALPTPNEYDFAYISNLEPNQPTTFLPKAVFGNVDDGVSGLDLPPFLIAANPLLTVLLQNQTTASSTSPLKVREYQSTSGLNAFADSGKFFMRLADGGNTQISLSSGGFGIKANLLGGGTVVWRPVSSSGPPTIDIKNHNTPGFHGANGQYPFSAITEIKFISPTPDPDPVYIPIPDPSSSSSFTPFIPFFPGLRMPGGPVYDPLN